MFKLNFLNKHYNVILRPHPKTLTINKDILRELEKLNYKVDKNFNQKIGQIIKCSDLILADYGAILFILVSKEKNDFIKFKRKYKIRKRFNCNKCRFLLREDVENLNTDISESDIYEKIENEFNADNYESLKDLKMKYFGHKTSLNLIQVKKYLETKLNN